MSNQFKTQSVIITLILLSVVPLVAQEDFNSKVLKQIDESEKARARLSESDKRLGEFYRIVRLAEEADTSTRSKQELKRFVDQDGRIKVRLFLSDVLVISRVSVEIASMNGVVLRAGTNVPYIVCLLLPKSLRQIIKLDDVLKLDSPAEPIIGPYNPNK